MSGRYCRLAEGRTRDQLRRMSQLMEELKGRLNDRHRDKDGRALQRKLTEEIRDLAFGVHGLIDKMEFLDHLGDEDDLEVEPEEVEDEEDPEGAEDDDPEGAEDDADDDDDERTLDQMVEAALKKVRGDKELTGLVRLLLQRAGLKGIVHEQWKKIPDSSGGLYWAHKLPESKTGHKRGPWCWALKCHHPNKEKPATDQEIRRARVKD